MKSVIIATLLVVFFVDFSNCDQVAETNGFIDQVIVALKAKQNFDPLVIGEHQKEMVQKIGFIDVHVKVTMHETKLFGLSNATRVGNAAMGNTNGSFSAKLQLGNANLKAYSNLTIHLGNLYHPDLTIEADIGHLTLTFSVELDKDGKASLHEFHIDEFQDVVVHVHGKNSALDSVMDFVVDSFNKLFNSTVREMLTQFIRPVLESELPKMMSSPK